MAQKASDCVAMARVVGNDATSSAAQASCRAAKAGAAKAGAAVGAGARPVATAFVRMAPKTAHKLGSAWEELEDAARQRAVKLLLQALRRAMRKIEALATAAAQEELDVKPESFPGRAVAGAVRRLTNDVFSEHLLPKIITETVLRRPAAAPLDSPPPVCCKCPLARSRAFLRYHLAPFDKGLFGMLRDPVYLLLLCVASFPYWWVSLGWWFVVLLLLLDVRDTFQLVEFIVSFKVSQFLGAFVKMVVDMTIFLLCVSHGDCHEAAPGIGESAYVAAALFGTQAFFLLVAVGAVPFSVAKGGMLYSRRRLIHKKGEGDGGERTGPGSHPSDGDGGGGDDDDEKGGEETEEEEAGGAHEYEQNGEHGRRGVRLSRWLAWELACFTVVTGLGLSVGLLEERDWMRQVYLHGICTLYALLGAPWLALKMPFMFLLVLRVTPTGYNRAGQTVAKLGGTQRRQLRQARLVQRRKVAPVPTSDPAAPKPRGDEVTGHDEAPAPEGRDYIAGSGGIMQLG